MMAKKTKKKTPTPEVKYFVEQYKRRIAYRNWLKENTICFHERLNKYPTYFRK